MSRERLQTGPAALSAGLRYTTLCAGAWKKTTVSTAIVMERTTLPIGQAPQG